MHRTPFAPLVTLAMLICCLSACESRTGDAQESPPESAPQPTKGPAPAKSRDQPANANSARIGASYKGPPFTDKDLTEAPRGGSNGPNLGKVRLPPGFRIHTYAAVPNARSLELAADGTLFVGNRAEDKVYAVLDRDRDLQPDRLVTVAEGLNMPNGVAVKGKDLFVAEVGAVWKFPGILDTLPKVPKRVLVNDAFPEDRHHGWKFIAFGPDGKLYVPVGAPCNICTCDYAKYCNIMRMNPDGSQLETFAKGVRNTVGFDWHPKTGELWFTDNGRDMLGDNLPPDELNRVTEKGQHFGYPYCHGGFVADPDVGEGSKCADFRAPARNLGPHVASLGAEFYEGKMFPAEYRDQLFIAEHGSWNRSSKIGYRITVARLNARSEVTSYEIFARGWQAGDSAWGRPVDLEEMPDGSLLVSDDAAGAVYRITYEAPKPPAK